MNEAQIRERLRDAVGDASYPAYLSSRVEARLKNPTREVSPRTTRRRESRWVVGLGHIGTLAAALLVMLLVAAVVVGVHIWRSTQPIPVGPDPAISQYQAMVAADQASLDNTPGYNCTTFADTKCVPEVELTTTALQKWLDDLNRSHPPARFASVNALMRRHLELAISANNALISGFRTRNRALMNASFNTLNNERDSVGHLAEDVIASSQGTVASHTSAIRSDRAYLLGCVLCQRLLRQETVSCPTDQTPSCADEIAAVRLQVETFQSDLVFDIAPDSLAAKDAALQADLSAADVALETMETALSNGDANALQSGLDALRHALSRAESDAAAIN